MKTVRLAALLPFLLAACASIPPATVCNDTATEECFTNPILANGADPWVIFDEGEYYYCYSDGNTSIYVSSADDFTRLNEARAQKIWKAPEGTAYSRHTWAPELHKIGDRWYVYFTADDGENDNHRMFVLESETEDAMGSYRFKGEIAGQYERWGIDGTVWQRRNGELYYIWSGWEGTENVDQLIYIARMVNPWTVEGERVELSRPEFKWEKDSIGVNEGPQMLVYKDSVNIIYSANGFWTDEYALGKLRLKDVSADPLDPQSWIKSIRPVFSSANEIYSPGHCSFTTSPDGETFWIVYHANQFKGSRGKREVRAQPFSWNWLGNPVFGKPQDNSVRFIRPTAE